MERKERSHRLIVKGAEFEKAFPLSRDLEQEDVQDVMDQLQNSSYNKSIVRQVHIEASHKEQQQIAEVVEKQKEEMTANGTVSFSVKQVSRGKGQTVVNSAAYISGQKLYNDYYGQTHDYTKSLEWFHRNPDTGICAGTSD